MIMHTFAWDFICNCTNVTKLQLNYSSHSVGVCVIEMSGYQQRSKK